MTAPFDVLVAGAGPAGSLTACLLARRGRRTLLVDRSRFPREKTCGSCLGGLALGALDRVGLGSLPDRLGAVPLTGAVVAAGGRSAGLSLPDGRALSRRRLDHALLAAARHAGAEVREAAPARLLAVEETGVVARVGEDRCRARVAVAADGLAGSFLADRPDLAPVVSPTSRIGLGSVVESAADYPAGTVHLAVGPAGYAGVVRLEDGRLDVAACLDRDRTRAEGGPVAVVADLLSSGGLPPVPELVGARWRGTPPLTRSRPRRAAERLFLVGDAAGYVEPFTGEGMGWALAGAVALAPLVSAATAGNRWRPALATAWEARHARVVGRRRTLCRTVSALLRRPRFVRLAVGLLSAVPRIAHPLVTRLNREAA